MIDLGNHASFILAAYGAAIGSEAARRADPKVKGFIGSSQDLTAPLFGADSGMGTMPHALVGYTGGDVLEAILAAPDESEGILCLRLCNGEELFGSQNTFAHDQTLAGNFDCGAVNAWQRCAH